MIVRTRFAPSPTGNIHIGNIRTALYSWLYARHNHGKFILRIEDSDSQRSHQKSIDTIIKSMKWLNLDWDEGPYYQSDRLFRYKQVIDDMLKLKVAYKCYCSKTRLMQLKNTQIARKIKPRYDRLCRNILYDNKKNEPYVIRFKNPLDGLITFQDEIRGLIQFNNKELDDLIIYRSDGKPTYNFCVVIDDLDMNITHVIRGEDHINNTPRQINILQSIGAKIPKYAHLPMILESDKKKISKRGNAKSVLEYKNDGYLYQAILNYLVRLGWSHGNKETFTINEMIDLFNLKSISKSPSAFNIDKLNWLNQFYIQNLPQKDIIENFKIFFQKEKINFKNGPKLSNIINLFNKRCKTLKEIFISSRYFYLENIEYNLNILKKHFSTHIIENFNKIIIYLKKLDLWTSNTIRLYLNKILIELGLTLKEIGIPMRIALTGFTCTPELNIIMELIGKDKSITRLTNVLSIVSTL
ncbi:glutamate--tRNA ligase [Candidatus Tachikawaea gelatinosa]|uniref:Glutamate--tRNA ligase n=1 Tax=Candidatus Tachikawaea gelatinosa TaxID=1410383 RepID=A0A090BWD6_9ENTR|nr:glutamate--tRNA ligase [Candidatus Tachikawaea gelatinosa]BAP58421.1 glutamate--tRNA ligase [Candidatus Tachikawaea gelatinosa]